MIFEIQKFLLVVVVWSCRWMCLFSEVRFQKATFEPTKTKNKFSSCCPRHRVISLAFQVQIKLSDRAAKKTKEALRNYNSAWSDNGHASSKCSSTYGMLSGRNLDGAEKSSVLFSNYLLSSLTSYFFSLPFFLLLSFSLYFSKFLSLFHILFHVFLFPFCIIVSLASVWWILRVRNRNAGVLPAVEFLKSICARMNSQIFTSWYAWKFFSHLHFWLRDWVSALACQVASPPPPKKKRNLVSQYLNCEYLMRCSLKGRLWQQCHSATLETSNLVFICVSKYLSFI